MTPKLSIIIPVYREAETVLSEIIRRIRAEAEGLPAPLEILLIDDGSEPPLPSSFGDPAVRVIRHPRNLGNGAAVKTGARAARAPLLLFMDGDGQHDPADIPALIAKIHEGFDLVVGSRTARAHASTGRRVANQAYNRLASLMTGQRIDDLTSGFRVARASRFRRFLYLLPNGFSYPTTSTMAFFRSGFPVAYVPVTVHARSGTSKIHIFKDGARFFLIIIKVGALFSPMRLFLPVSLVFFMAALLRYFYTYVTDHRFTNMSAVFLVSAMFTFLIGIVSEQVSALHYRDTDRDLPESGQTDTTTDKSASPNTSHE